MSKSDEISNLSLKLLGIEKQSCNARSVAFFRLQNLEPIKIINNNVFLSAYLNLYPVSLCSNALHGKEIADRNTSCPFNDIFFFSIQIPMSTIKT